MNKKYFEWLKNQVDFLDFPEAYDKLFLALYMTEFTWKHPMDRNRALEAIEIRSGYVQDTGTTISFTLPVNVLEVLISIARRMNFICSSFDEDKTKIIFWRLLSNLGLTAMVDSKYQKLDGDNRVEFILDIWMERLYGKDGRGGIFPMDNPRQNQREVELWYQMNQYLNDPNGEDLKSY